MFKMLELNVETNIRALEGEGFRRTKRMTGSRFPPNTFRHERENEIYIVAEVNGGKVRALEYYNLETGEIDSVFKEDMREEADYDN